MIADLDDLGRILHESIVELGDVNEAVLVHADVYEYPEVRHVSDNPFQPHPGFDVANRLRRRRIAPARTLTVDLGRVVRARREYRE